jgi:hypothetical protein
LSYYALRQEEKKEKDSHPQAEETEETGSSREEIQGRALGKGVGEWQSEMM